MASESLLRDSNTLSPWQIGQASRVLTYSSRSSAVRGPDERDAPTARRPTTTSTSATHIGQRLIVRRQLIGAQSRDDRYR